MSKLETRGSWIMAALLVFRTKFLGGVRIELTK